MTQNTSYQVLVTDSGRWLYTASTDFVFAYMAHEWDSELKERVRKAYEVALEMPQKIKNAVKETAGQDVVNGLYLLDLPSMIKAMNCIEGMGMTKVKKREEKGSATAVEINQAFFASVLAGAGGSIEPIVSYLTEEMGDFQVQVKESQVTEYFGTVVGLISVNPDIGVPVTTFKYVFASKETSEWLVDLKCVSTEHYNYDYKYTVANYNYHKDKGCSIK